MFLNNPEFRKNFKLEVSATRIMACAIIMLLVAYAAYSGTSTLNFRNYASPGAKQAISVYKAFCTTGFLFAIVYGSYLAASSITSELHQRTWTFLSMSPLPPSRILVGKMFGATALIWIITLAIIIPAFVISLSVAIPGEGYIRPETVTIGIFVTALILWIISSHAGALLLALQTNLSHRETSDKRNSILYALITLLAGLSIGSILSGSLENFYELRSFDTSKSRYLAIDQNLVVGPGKYLVAPEKLSWYGVELYLLDMFLIILAFSAFWLVTAAYRSLRKTLHFHDTPWVWGLFLIAATIFLFGFEESQDHKYDIPLFASGMLIIIMSVLLSCMEAGDTIRYQSWIARIQQRKFAEAFRITPLWMISVVAFLCLIPISLSLSSTPVPVTMIACSTLLFATRDILVIHALSWSKLVKRPWLAISIYGLFVYGLTPWIAGRESELFFPIMSRHVLGRPEAVSSLYWALILPQIVIAAGLCLRLWKKMKK